MRSGLKVSETPAPDHDDRAAMGAALTRLYGAATEGVRDIVATLTESERARLAVFCYGRAHLNATGLAIAATCSLEVLMTASHSPTAARTLFTQSRDRAAFADKPLARRMAITLAPSGGSRTVMVEPAESVA